MKAELLPLSGKYYGTKIRVVDDDGFGFEIKLWNSGNFEPSDRELDGVCTIGEWRNNKILPLVNSWTGEIGVSAKEVIEICDSHFESRVTHRMVVNLVDKINQNE